MRVLITGGTGFIGQYLVIQVLARGYRPVLLLRESHSGQPLPPRLNPIRRHCDIVYADLRNFQLTGRAVRDAAADVVMHLAAAGVTDPFLGIETALRHNVTGTTNLLRACFAQNEPPRQFIMGRTPGERSAMNVYAASKAAAWQFARMYSRTQQWPIHGAMIFQTYGPGQPTHTLIPSAIAAAQAGEDFPMTAGTQARDWITVNDVVTGLLALVGADLPPGTTVDLGTGRLHTVAEVVRQIYALAAKGGQPHFGALPSRPGEESHQVAAADQTKSQIGWQATTDLATGLAQLLTTPPPA